MTLKETGQIMAYLRELYPNGSAPTRTTVNAWHDLLQPYPYEIAWEAAKAVASTWDGYTMPPPAAIISKIKMATGEQDADIALWRIAEKAIRRGTAFTQSEFDQLPEPVRQYFGGVSAIRDLALLDASQLPNERARFLKQMPILKERAEAQALLGESVSKWLTGLLTGGEDAI